MQNFIFYLISLVAYIFAASVRVGVVRECAISDPFVSDGINAVIQTLNGYTGAHQINASFVELAYFTSATARAQFDVLVCFSDSTSDDSSYSVPSDVYVSIRDFVLVEDGGLVLGSYFFTIEKQDLENFVSRSASEMLPVIPQKTVGQGAWSSCSTQNSISIFKHPITDGITSLTPPSGSFATGVFNQVGGTLKKSDGITVVVSNECDAGYPSDNYVVAFQVPESKGRSVHLGPPYAVVDDAGFEQYKSGAWQKLLGNSVIWTTGLIDPTPSPIVAPPPQSETPIIVGAVIAAIVVVVIFVVVMVLLNRYAKKREDEREVAEMMMVSPFGKDEKNSFAHLPAMGDEAEWNIPQEKVTLGEEIGSGVFGTVYKGTWNNKQVAVKTFRSGTLPITDERFVKVYNALFRVKAHPNLVRSYGYTTQPSIVMELMNETLFDFISGSKQLTGDMALEWARGISSAILYLHLEGIVHRTIFVSGGVPKIGDWALCMMFNTQMPSNPRCLAPECVTDKSFTDKSDVWAFGIVLWEMVTRKRAYSDIFDDNQVMTRVGSRIAPQVPSEGPLVLCELMAACWAVDAKERINMKGANVALSDGIDALA